VVWMHQATLLDSQPQSGLEAGRHFAIVRLFRRGTTKKPSGIRRRSLPFLACSRNQDGDPSRASRPVRRHSVIYIYIYVHALSFMHPHRPHCLDIQGWLKCCVPVYFCNTWTRLVTSDECTSGILPDMSRQHLIVTKSISPVNCWGQTLAVAISLPDQTGNIQTRSIRPPET
jgi:hypothetical protein